MKLKQGIIILVAALVAIGVQADTFGTGTNQFIVDFVEIGNVGNAADASGYGAVGYAYRIGTYEITLDQFAKARTLDGLIGDGDEGHWNENTRTVGTSAPASQASWQESAKFANWLTTGNAYTGIYQFNGSGVLTGIDRSFRNGSYVAYVLPSEDEWYKAAYYKPVNDGSYSIYASGLDTVPIQGYSNGWNYWNNGTLNADPNQMWEVGSGSIEQNGTYDMMGNVREWTESSHDGSVNNMAVDRVFRGGSAYTAKHTLQSSDRPDGPTTIGNHTVGFRVAKIGTGFPPPIEVSIQNEADSVAVEWSSLDGATYQVQYSTNLVSTNWFDLGSTIVGDGLTNSIIDSTLGMDMRFYRVIKE